MATSALRTSPGQLRPGLASVRAGAAAPPKRKDTRSVATKTVNFIWIQPPGKPGPKANLIDGKFDDKPLSRFFVANMGKWRALNPGWRIKLWSKADVEALGYAFGCVPFPSAGVGAPHIRDRAYWMANAGGLGLQERIGERRIQREAVGSCEGEAAVGGGHVGGLANARGQQLQGAAGDDKGPGKSGREGAAGRLGNAVSSRRQPQQANLRVNGHGVEQAGREQVPGFEAGSDVLDGQSTAGPVNGFWRDADWLLCRDGKWRPVEPGTFPLVDGAPARVGRLRGYGNAINAEAATAFVQAVMGVS